MLIWRVNAFSIVLVDLDIFGSYDDNLFDSCPAVLILILLKPRLNFEPFSYTELSFDTGDGAFSAWVMFFKSVGLVSIICTFEASYYGYFSARVSDVWTVPKIFDLIGCLDKFLLLKLLWNLGYAAALVVKAPDPILEPNRVSLMMLLCEFNLGLLSSDFFSCLKVPSWIGDSLSVLVTFGVDSALLPHDVSAVSFGDAFWLKPFDFYVFLPRLWSLSFCCLRRFSNFGAGKDVFSSLVLGFSSFLKFENKFLYNFRSFWESYFYSVLASTWFLSASKVYTGEKSYISTIKGSVSSLSVSSDWTFSRVRFVFWFTYFVWIVLFYETTLCLFLLLSVSTMLF